MGEETRNCFATAIEAQGAVLSVFSLASLPIEIVNKLFKEEINSSAASQSQNKKRQNHPAPVSQPVINEYKPLKFEKRWINPTGSPDQVLVPQGYSAVLEEQFSGNQPYSPDRVIFLFFLAFLIILALSNLPANIFIKLNRIYPPGPSGPGFFILH